MKSKDQNSRDAKLQRLLNALARNVAKYRHDHYISVRDFAEETNLCTSTLTDIEGGVGNPKIETLYRIASYTGVSVTDLFETPQSDTYSSVKDVVRGLRRHAAELANMADLLEAHING